MSFSRCVEVWKSGSAAERVEDARDNGGPDHARDVRAHRLHEDEVRRIVRERDRRDHRSSPTHPQIRLAISHRVSYTTKVTGLLPSLKAKTVPPRPDDSGCPLSPHIVSKFSAVVGIGFFLPAERCVSAHQEAQRQRFSQSRSFSPSRHTDRSLPKCRLSCPSPDQIARLSVISVPCCRAEV